MTVDDWADRKARAAGGFGDGPLYDAHRPSYPAGAVAWLLDGLGVQPGDAVIDLGAGTGKFTAHLLDAGLEVLAVEPSASMRGVLVERLANPRLRVMDGHAEQLPAADASMAAVFSAQAFHWFDPGPAVTEMARVARPGGGVGLIWNERDDSVPWVHDLHVAMDWDRRAPYDLTHDFSTDLRRGPFTRVGRRRFGFRHALDHDAIVGRVLTTSYITLMDAGERTALVDRVRGVLSRLPALVDLPYVTDAYVAVKG